MSERTRKAASLVKQIVAGELVNLPDSARYTVTGVDVAPDLRTATVWIGIIGDDELFARVESHKSQFQSAVARRMETKFIPKLSFAQDNGGEYASHISKLIKGI